MERYSYENQTEDFVNQSIREIDVGYFCFCDLQTCLLVTLQPGL
ncbi:hypothetical protein SAMN04487988_110114 [Algoriphagus hitonicola]|uniref:Uncharacterized protein n=1 Tax=Algoriphagus hitonicola TaxID=435880 RepID=A0A1I2VRK0_9BACT|nr:hypothetical protein SAMN04487988_110114 [Algoriphagus hitonicola]